MLAQTFKSPTNLNLQNDLYTALIEVLRMLEAEEFTYVMPYGEPAFRVHVCSRPRPTLFNMTYWANAFDDCGTVMCMGGAAEALMRRTVTPQEEQRLFHLFYPPYPYGSFSHILPADAAHTLRRFLETGEIKWNK